MGDCINCEPEDFEVSHRDEVGEFNDMGPVGEFLHNTLESESVVARELAFVAIVGYALTFGAVIDGIRNIRGK